MPGYTKTDALIAQIKGHKERVKCEDELIGFVYKVAHDDIIEIIKDESTTDVEEVKHATWECTDKSNNVWKCSGKDGCEEHFILYEGTPEDNNYKRCPNCGAKMDGKRNE